MIRDSGQGSPARVERDQVAQPAVRGVVLVAPVPNQVHRQRRAVRGHLGGAPDEGVRGAERTRPVLEDERLGDEGAQFLELRGPGGGVRPPG